MIAAGTIKTRLLPQAWADTVPISEPTLPETAAILAFFNRCKAMGTLPHRQDLPNRELAYVMPSLYILEPETPEGLDWRVRLMGHSLVELYGVDCTGLLQSEFMTPEAAAQQAAKNREIVSSGEPRLSQGRLMGLDRDFHEFESIYIPIIGRDGVTKWLLAGIFVHNPR